MPSLSSLPSLEPSGKQDDWLNCTGYECGNGNGEPRFTLCFVNAQTKMTHEVCSRRSILFNGDNEHYCGPCKNECHEVLDETDVCDDAHYCKFNLQENGNAQKRCLWLSQRNENIRDMYCADESISKMCAETCGICKDTCVDSDSGKVPILDIMRECSWLRSRPDLRKHVCFEGQEAWDVCKETCGNCNGTLVVP